MDAYDTRYHSARVALLDAGEGTPDAPGTPRGSADEDALGPLEVRGAMIAGQRGGERGAAIARQRVLGERAASAFYSYREASFGSSLHRDTRSAPN